MSGPVPTDAAQEQEKGRVALWLDPEDMAWLSRICRCPADASESEKERCARVRFRARAALHKAGLRD
ncbi:hypothetical protein CHH27_13105 [Labrenzia sp. VG12]|nr:hypothetical protein CHH27_13105 [Labrenzia sp. VG12]